MIINRVLNITFYSTPSSHFVGAQWPAKCFLPDATESTYLINLLIRANLLGGVQHYFVQGPSIPRLVNGAMTSNFAGYRTDV